MADTVPAEIMPFVDAFKGLKMSLTTFGYILDENWKNVIADFEDKFMLLHHQFNVTCTNKLHVLIEHVPQVISRTNKPLGEGTDHMYKF